MRNPVASRAGCGPGTAISMIVARERPLHHFQNRRPGIVRCRGPNWPEGHRARAPGTSCGEPDNVVPGDVPTPGEPEAFAPLAPNHESEVERPIASARSMIPAVQLRVVRIGGEHL